MQTAARLRGSKPEEPVNAKRRLSIFFYLFMNHCSQSSPAEASLTAVVKHPNKRLYAAYIRAIAACAVVQMHSIGGYLYWYGSEAAALHPQFITANIYYSHLRWATPFFIMLSGALLLSGSRQEEVKAFLSKRMRRVLIPFAFWGGIYLLYAFRGALYYGPLPTWQEVFHKVFYEDIYFHLWFIPMIAGLYLLTPLLRVWVRAMSRFELEYLLLLIFLFNAAHVYLPGFFIVKHFSWFGYIGYYLLGYYLSAHAISLRWKRWIYAGALLMPLFSAGLTWWLSAQKGTYAEEAFMYASPNVVLMTFGWFLFLRNVNWDAVAVRYPWLHRGAMYVAEVSYGVYFIHPLLLDALKNGYLGVTVNPHNFLNTPVPIALGGLLTSIVATGLSIGVIALMRRSAFVRRWLV